MSTRIAETVSTRTPPRRLFALAALALGGVGVSVYLSQHYYEIRNGSAGFKSLCNLGATLNCDAVAASSYADLMAGLPLSSFAAGWFLALFAIALIARNPFWRREAVRAGLLVTGASVIFSIFYLYIMMGVLHTSCLFCLVTDAINIFSFGIVLSLKPEGFTHHKLDVAKWKPLVGLTATALVISVLGLRSLDEENLSKTQIEEAANSALSSPILPVNAGPEFPTLGPANAPITIVEFSDFQCPFCRIGAFVINSVYQQNLSKVRVVFRNFPLDASCNRIVQHPMHQYSCEAARAAYCANQQGKFEAVYQSFFQNQTSFAPGKIMELAQDAGANAQQLTSCLVSPLTASAIARDIEEGITLMPTPSTPTFFINGHKIEGPLPPAVWNRMIAKLSHSAPGAYR